MDKEDIEMATFYRTTAEKPIDRRNTIRLVIRRIQILSILIILSVGGCLEDRSAEWNRLIKVADGLYEENRYGNAVAKYQEAAAIKPNDEHSLKRLGLCYLRMGEYADAANILKRYELLKPEDLGAKAEIIRISLLKKDLEAARHMLAKLDDNQKKYAEIILLQGDMEMIREKYKKAEEIYLGILEKDKENISASISLAMSKYAQGEIDSAELIINEIKHKRIVEPALLLKLGDYYRLAKNDQRAEKAYLDAVENRRGEIGYRLHIANYYLDKSKYENAITYLNQILSGDPFAHAARKLIVQALLSVSDLENARNHLSVLEENGITDNEMLMLKGRYYLQASEPALAATYFESAIRNDPESAVAHYWNAVALLNTGQIRLAKQQLINTLTFSPGFTEAEIALCGIYYRSKEYDLAKEHLSRIIERDPNNVRSYKLLGGVLLGQNKITESIQAFKKATEIDPQDCSAQYYLGRLYEQAGQSENAQKVYFNILENKIVVNAALRYAKLLVDANKTSEARQYFSEMLGENPDNSIVLFVLGEISFHEGDHEQTLKYLKKLIKDKPKFVPAYIRLADMYIQMGESESAKKVLLLCEAKNRRAIKAYLMSASLRHSLNLYDETLEVLMDAEKIFRNNDIVKNNMACLYLKKNSNLNKALKLAQSAYQRNDDVPSFIDTLGWAYHKKGMHRQALWYLKRGLHELEKEGCKESAHCAIMRYHLGSVLFSLKNYVESERYLKSSLSIGLDGSEADTANSLLNAIQNENERASLVDDKPSNSENSG